MAVHLPQIGRYRVDHDQSHVADFLNLPFEGLKVSLQVERAAPTGHFLNGRHNMHPVKVSPGRHQARNDGIASTVLSAKNDGVPQRGVAFIAGPLASSRNRGNDSDAQLAFASARFASDGGMFAARKPAWPYPVDFFRLDVRGFIDNQLRADDGLVIGFHLVLLWIIYCWRGVIERREKSLATVSEVDVIRIKSLDFLVVQAAILIGAVSTFICPGVFTST